MAWFRRFWPFWLAFVVLAVLIAWPGRLAYLNHLTVKEAERIVAITPTEVAAVIPARLSIERLMADVNWLAAPEREGRLAGSAGGLATREYIIQRFEELGLQPGGSDGYLHPFNTPSTELTANIIGIIPGTELKKGKPLKTIVLSAHYDHLGVHNGQIYHGADDNASGTAAILEIARYLMEYPNKHPIAIMALDHEERGLRGSRALFSTEFLDPNTLAFNLNLDMISRDTNQTLFAVGTYHSPWLAPLIRRVQQESGVKLIMAHDKPKYKAGYTPDWTNSSDHGPFHQQGIPFIYFGVADHPDYHQPTDTADRVDVDFYRAAAETSLSLLLLVDQVLAEK
ncbi:M28 family peptidase [Aliidiomarina quisquiliarum]|uniref:M28 family peptidase n=1 Tax=Aliidiomarina quisquiliarum TaxID=2938947 RepID=UPI00208DDD30|nr:M28 family peptidase [Aliidiomarina quisquiliarum]MCO4322121.1 M28 family peptidase [Aliidiomarina quisquiliarum]